MAFFWLTFQASFYVLSKTFENAKRKCLWSIGSIPLGEAESSVMLPQNHQGYTENSENELKHGHLWWWLFPVASGSAVTFICL